MAKTAFHDRQHASATAARRAAPTRSTSAIWVMIVPMAMVIFSFPSLLQRHSDWMALRSSHRHLGGSGGVDSEISIATTGSVNSNSNGEIQNVEPATCHLWHVLTVSPAWVTRVEEPVFSFGPVGHQVALELHTAALLLPLLPGPRQPEGTAADAGKDEYRDE